MPLRVDQLSLGPIGTNCYVVRADATRRRGRRRRSERRRDRAPPDARAAGRALRGDPRDARALGPPASVSPTSPRAPARLCTCPRASGCCSSSPRHSRRSAAASRAHVPEVTLAGGETLELAGHRVRRPGRSRPLARAPRLPRRRLPLLRRRALRRVGRPDRSSRRRLGDARSPRSACSSTRSRPRRSSTRATGRSRRSAPSSRGTRSSPSSARSAPGEPSVADRASARHARRPPVRAAALAARHGGDRAAVRALRLPADHDAGVRGHGALRADVRRGLGRRAEGDVHVLGPLRPLADAASRRATAPICRAYVEHGLHREPQPAKLFTIASMYRYGAPGKGRYREHWQASVEAIGSDDPSIDAELIQLYDALLRRLGVTQYHLELNSIGCRECRPAYLEALRALARRESRAARRGDAREGGDEPAARVRQLPGEAGGAFAPRSTRRRRSASRSAPSASSASPSSERDLDAAGVALPARSDARARARLLLAHDLGVRRAARERERDALGGRPLRLPRRGDRRAADAGRRLRCRHRAAAPRDGGRGRRERRAAADRRLLRARRRTRRASASRAGSRSCARAASRATPTTRAARSRASSRRPAGSGRDDRGRRRRRERDDPRAGRATTRPSPTTSFSTDCRR